jgi:hypothetical protein
VKIEEVEALKVNLLPLSTMLILKPLKLFRTMFPLDIPKMFETPSPDVYALVI